MSCVHSPITCGACRDGGGLEHGLAEAIPQSTAATASVLVVALSAAKDESRRLAEENVLLRREIEELKNKLKRKSRQRREKR